MKKRLAGSLSCMKAPAKQAEAAAEMVPADTAATGPQQAEGTAASLLAASEKLTSPLDEQWSSAVKTRIDAGKRRFEENINEAKARCKEVEVDWEECVWTVEQDERQPSFVELVPWIDITHNQNTFDEGCLMRSYLATTDEKRKEGVVETMRGYLEFIHQRIKPLIDIDEIEIPYSLFNSGNSIFGEQGIVSLFQAKLQGADLRRAQLQGAYLWGAQLQGALLETAQLQGARLEGAQLQGANLKGAQLDRIDLTEANLSGTELANATWKEPPASLKQIKVATLETPKMKQPKQKPFILKSLAKPFFSACSAGQGDEAGNDESDEDQEEGGLEAGQKQAGGDMPVEADCDLTSVPLLTWCRSKAEEFRDELMSDVQDSAQDLTCAKLDDTEEQLSEKIGTLRKEGKERLLGVMKSIDATVKPRMKAAVSILESFQNEELMKSVKDKQGLKKAFELFSNLKSAKEASSKIDEFEKELKKTGGKGLSLMLAKLADSAFASATGYSSGDCLRIFRYSKADMSNDIRELVNLDGYLEKLHDTVNMNNWDDVIDNFTCLYSMKDRLRGVRSQQVFNAIWKDQGLRYYVAVGALFQDVAPVNNPPHDLIHFVKEAVKIVKTRYPSWRDALHREIAKGAPGAVLRLCHFRSVGRLHVFGNARLWYGAGQQKA
eukprot:TRINITY_DN10172_c0_g1_i2.p1 TRINITY_DN10172_c0_g1~~TRINITY_DN10172_c0_g1_i2.p1  ORF type:complete len:664 (-),score=176.69 TRINITY_DN10172_c0_g1_i2:129-2120(-)